MLDNTSKKLTILSKYKDIKTVCKDTEKMLMSFDYAIPLYCKRQRNKVFYDWIIIEEIKIDSEQDLIYRSSNYKNSLNELTWYKFTEQMIVAFRDIENIPNYRNTGEINRYIRRTKGFVEYEQIDIKKLFYNLGI